MANTIHQTIRLCIPKKYQKEPIISKLISEYHLNVNICAALLGADSYSSGWFDLDLDGEENSIQAAIAYLTDLDVLVKTSEEQY
ncbi:NIL domain-containing protein [Phormidium yuhuli AB48]|uniref:NIL domain-containing protein n=1 Tax=Phormidium yuhuli AB48 TaxID=2940671 RepID=A0ABY5AR29_9CYAN|nr:NIL domain-containing protein [Phormidium yuhuli]USR90806.1 NIL domain-containing protein [Phormidium yuhuli AB48]